jgi:hypothetical protein
MEPSRLTDLCDPVTAARGSFATVMRARLEGDGRQKVKTDEL